MKLKIIKSLQAIKKVVLIAIVIFGVSCGQQNNFNTYTASLNAIALPVVICAKMKVDISPNYNKSLFTKFKHSWSYAPIGKINGHDFVCVLEYIAADNGYLPILMTYDLKGNKRDSLPLLDKTGNGDYGKTVQTAKINKDFSFVISDTSWTWDTDNAYNPIDSTIIIKTAIHKYQIKSTGQIIKNGG